MTLAEILFFAFSLLAIVSALLVVSLKNTARALFLFFIVLFAMAGLYLFALADFVAITQIMVYVGGVLILMIFAFMLSNKELLKDLQATSAKFLSLPNWPSLLLALAFFVVMATAFVEWQTEGPIWVEQAKAQGTEIKATDNNIRELGFRFMTFYILPFEIIGIFLMMTLMGAAHLSRKDGQS